MFCVRGSSRVWRRFTDDQLEYLMLSLADSCRQTRIETRDPRRGVVLKGLDTVLAASFGGCEPFVSTEHFDTTPPGPTRPTLTKVPGGYSEIYSCSARTPR